MDAVSLAALSIFLLLNFINMRNLNSLQQILLTPCRGGLTVFSLFLLSHVPLRAQDFLTKIDSSELGLTEGENAYLARIMAAGMADEINFCEMADVEDFQRSGILTFMMPLTDDTLQAEAVEVNYSDSSNFMWQGTLIGSKHGYVTFMKSPDGFAGMVQTDSAFWDILPLRKKVGVLRLQNLDTMTRVACDYVGAVGTSSTSELSCPSEAFVDCPSTVDVLVLVAQDAIEWYNTNDVDPFVQLIHLAVGTESFNFALENSGVHNARARFTFLPFEFEYYDPINADIYVDLGDLPGQADALRDEVGADLVMLINARDYPNVRGIANGGALLPNEDYPYAIATVQNIVNPAWTFVHELGHLFGARHNEVTNGGDDYIDWVCRHGWKWDTDPGINRSLLAVIEDGEIQDGHQRALQFSNPEIEFNNFVTGDEWANNARQISYGACIADEFRVDEAHFQIGLAGPPWICENKEEAFSANADAPAIYFPGQPPYTYEWRWNTSGIFTPASPGTYLGNTQTIEIGALNLPYFFVQVAVTSDDNVTLTRTRRVRVYPENDGLCDENPQRQANLTTSIVGLSVYPNPAMETVNVSFGGDVDLHQIKEVRLLNAQGIKMNVPCAVLGKQQNSAELDVAELPSGIYFIEVWTPTDRFTQTLSIFHN